MNLQSFYICHHCISYKSQKKNDIKRHLERQKICDPKTIISYDEAVKLSLLRKYIFDFDISNLQINDYLFIIKNYIKDINYIHFDFYSISNQNQLINENQDELFLTNQKENNINSRKKKDLFYYKYFNEEKNKYVCNECLSEYLSKQSLQIHLTNKKQCEEKKEILEFKKIQELELKELNELKEKKLNNTYNNYNTVNNFNSNIQNNNNVQNNNNNNSNTNNSTYNLSINDFVHDRYDITHIKDSYYEQKDFFVFTNFLNMIMQNKNNQNIFFTDNRNEAIIYSDNELNRVSSDKAGYLILDKLSQSFEEILHKQDKETIEYYSFITKYYNVLKGQYKHDTIYKCYDVNKKQFVYTSSSNLFRSRDKNLQKMITSLEDFNVETRKNLKFNINDTRRIPLINPNIENFASIRMRYRDLKDKN